MANRVGALTTFATTSPPWSLALLDANTTALGNALNDSSLGWMNGIPNDTGIVNNYAVVLPYGTASGYNPGFTVTFIPTNTNTGASTLAVGGLGPVPIVDVFGNPLMAGFLVAGKAALVQYTGTNFRLLTSGQTGGVSYYYDYDDFVVGYPGISAGTVQGVGTKLLTSWIVGGATSAALITSIPGHPGIWRLSAAASNAAVLAAVANGDNVATGGNSPLFLDGQTNILMRSILQPNALGTNVDITFGLWQIHDANLATGNYSFLGFAGNLNRNSNWLAWANSSNANVTSTSTGIALTAGTWYTLEFTYAAATGIMTYFINNTQVATVNTNLPAAATPLFPGFQVVGNAGGSSTLYVDTFEIQVNPGIANRFLYGAT